MTNVTQIEEAIKNVFGVADQLARDTGGCRNGFRKASSAARALRRHRSWGCSNPERRP